MYRLRSIKGTGYVDGLINAIDGLTELNCPSNAEYLKTRMLGKKVKAYLRS